MPKRDGTHDADFPGITMFGRTAENCERYLKKGSLVGIRGRLHTSTYTDKNGVRRFSTGVIANEIQFIQTRKNGAKEEENSSQSKNASCSEEPAQQQTLQQELQDQGWEEVDGYDEFDDDSFQ